MATIDGTRVAFVVANEGVEQSELCEPLKAVQRAGGRPLLVAPEPGDVQAMHHLDKAETFPVDFMTKPIERDDGITVVPTVHPSSILRAPDAAQRTRHRLQFVDDLRRANELAGETSSTP